MKLLNNTILFALVTLACNVSLAQVPEKPVQANPVVDLAGIIGNDSLMAALNTQLDSLSHQTQNQVVVVTVKDMGALTPNEFATELGNKWGVGGKALNNGLVIVVKPKTEDSPGQVGFATGHGLEGAFPDVFCKRLQEEYMIPHFKEGDYGMGIKAAIDEIEPVLRSEYKDEQKALMEKKSSDGGGNGWFIIAIILGVIALFMLLRKRSKPATTAQQQVADAGNEVSLAGDKKAGAGALAATAATAAPKEDTEPEEVEEEPEEAEKTEKPEPYKYSYGGGTFGGGGASSSW